MKRKLIVVLSLAGVLGAMSCHTVATTTTGALVGAGIGSIAGDTQTGAIVGGSVGFLAGVF